MLATQCWLVLWNYDEFECTYVGSLLLSDVAEANCSELVLVCTFFPATPTEKVGLFAHFAECRPINWLHRQCCVMSSAVCWCKMLSCFFCLCASLLFSTSDPGMWSHLSCSPLFPLSILKPLSLWMGDSQGYSMRSLVAVWQSMWCLREHQKHSVEAVSLLMSANLKDSLC